MSRRKASKFWLAGLILIAVGIPIAAPSLAAKRKSAAHKSQSSASGFLASRKYDVLNPNASAPRVSVGVDNKKDDSVACRIAVKARADFQASRISRGRFDSEVGRAKDAASNSRMIALIDLIRDGAKPWCPTEAPPPPPPAPPMPSQVTP